jgi:hypothetical protein
MFLYQILLLYLPVIRMEKGIYSRVDRNYFYIFTEIKNYARHQKNISY